MFGQKKRHQTRIDSVIGQRTQVNGDVTFAGGLHIDGAVCGNVSAQMDEKATLTVSERGSIEGEVRVPYIILNGTVKGDVHASDRVELAANARVEGDVHYRMIEMAMGAEVNGKLVRMADEVRAPLALSHATMSAVADEA